MYAAAASAQLRPEPGTPGAEALGYFATLEFEPKLAYNSKRTREGTYSNNMNTALKSKNVCRARWIKTNTENK